MITERNLDYLISGVSWIYIENKCVSWIYIENNCDGWIHSDYQVEIKQ